MGSPRRVSRWLISSSVSPLWVVSHCSHLQSLLKQLFPPGHHLPRPCHILPTQRTTQTAWRYVTHRSISPAEIIIFSCCGPWRCVTLMTPGRFRSAVISIFLSGNVLSTGGSIYLQEERRGAVRDEGVPKGCSRVILRASESPWGARMRGILDEYVDVKE